ncbi:hypothetical protein [Actinoplanes aureus]|uniref:Uncharacterized protein n=1 Tax=Actinoplanes aureus TaxID=2792083 RepID=A0A931CJH2_9ACTN|nr:hypothetical protein [Actinoplanes aureus]MBG0569147.1 hypothetical protein [Actinoplanes aureus]
MRRPLIATASGRSLDRGAVWRLLRRLAKTADITLVMSPHILTTLTAPASADLPAIGSPITSATPPRSVGVFCRTPLRC